MRYWKKVDKDGKTTTVESYSHNLDVEGAVEISEAEFVGFLNSLPQPEVEPFRDLAAELDILKVKVAELEEM